MARLIDLVARRLTEYWPGAEIGPLLAAYEFAAAAHRGQRRLSGEPYVCHPVAVANILTTIEADPASLVAALLHDTVEDNDSVGLADIAERFGDTVASLIDGVTKLRRLDFASREEDQASNLRKMLLAMARDLRVVLIKLADRLHNLRTLWPLPPDTRRAKAEESLYIFAPLAHRLGVWRMKAEMEDLSFRYLEPRAYWTIRRQLGQSQAERESLTRHYQANLRNKLLAAGLPAEVFGRAKHIYSIWRKMQTEDLPIESIRDLIGLRILLHTEAQCYQALGVVHDLWHPIPGEFSDYIANPKSNRYQSLHTKVLGEHGGPVEIQIRTWEMHRVAEYGVAAHWRYKEGTTDAAFDEQIAWLRRLLELSSDLAEQHDYWETVQGELLSSQVFVFSPKGQVFDLPAGSTPLDFAYRVHTDVGNHCAGARVNGKPVALDYRLRTGDVVEIVTSVSAEPRLEWLNIARSSHAKAKVRRYLRAKARHESIEAGHQAVLRALEHLPAAERARAKLDRLSEVAAQLGFPDQDSLFAAVGYGDVEASTIARRICEEEQRRPTSLAEEVQLKLPSIESAASTQALPVATTGGGSILARPARCCNPVPGDTISGYITRGGGIAVHRAECPNIRYRAAREPERIIPLVWGPRDEGQIFRVWIEVVAVDRRGLLSHIAAIVSDSDINITAAQARTDAPGLAKLWLELEVHERRQLDHLLERMRLVADVVTVREVPRHMVPTGALNASDESRPHVSG
ncbi:MAG: bifunctional (p)ppGpp synthetase/guanosine-3',5'-bis(diphosphate) 3'-pyrophosphohydrolase [Armatimonadetes bacterium]|nr:bifunctional (p)ppGpp synthetase/guanosine-3',5'-bis(diphosphate) 3'-pyrophosphohydrolase [Armatimonadota bacterium]